MHNRKIKLEKFGFPKENELSRKLMMKIWGGDDDPSANNIAATNSPQYTVSVERGREVEKAKEK